MKWSRVQTIWLYYNDHSKKQFNEKNKILQDFNKNVKNTFDIKYIT